MIHKLFQLLYKAVPSLPFPTISYFLYNPFISSDISRISCLKYIHHQLLWRIIFRINPSDQFYFTLTFTYFSGYTTVMRENYWVAPQGSNYQFPSTYGLVPHRRRSRENVQENYRRLSRTWQRSYDEVEVWDESDFIEHQRSNLSTNISEDHRVQTNFSQETILRHLKTRKFTTSEEAKTTNEGPEICVVCQCEYRDHENIGHLRCGHEYHVDCITRWLYQKNVCPICKATAIPRREEVARV